MSSLIRTIFGLVVLLFCLLVAMLTMGKSSKQQEVLAYQVDTDADNSVYFHDLFTHVSYNAAHISKTDQTYIYSSGLHPVLPVLQWHYPAWSPDGTKIAFMSERDGNPNLYLLDLNANLFLQLTNSSWAELEPVWSPDGTLLAYETIRNGNEGISILDLKTGKISDVAAQVGISTDDLFPMRSPTWSPDSSRIAFQGAANNYWDIYIFDLQTQDLFNITNSARDEMNPVWSTQP